MAGITPNPRKRGYTLPPGCRELIDVLNFPKGKPVVHSLDPVKVRVNGKIIAPELRVVGIDGKQRGLMPLAEGLRLARSLRVDLVEIAPKARPPVCRLVDFGKFWFEKQRRQKKK